MPSRRAILCNPSAAEELLPLVNEELRTLAAQWLANEAPGQTLQPTVLVHDVWLKLVGPGPHLRNRRPNRSMSARQEELQALFDQALSWNPDERAAFLSGACGDDAELLERMEALIQADSEAGTGHGARGTVDMARYRSCATLIILPVFRASGAYGSIEGQAPCGPPSLPLAFKLA